MKVLIIYKSISHGSTKKIAEVIQEATQGVLLTPEKFTMDSLNEYSCIGFGSGIYKGKHHESIFDLLDCMPVQKEKKAFVFSTSGSGMLIQHAALKNKLMDKGFRVIGEFGCPGINDYGPMGILKILNLKLRTNRPSNSDLRKAKCYFEKLQDI